MALPVGINLAFPFIRTTNSPLDGFSKLANDTDRDLIPSGVRYLGMVVFCENTLQFFTLKTGLTNSDWEEFAPAVTPFTGEVLDYMWFTNTTIDGSSGLVGSLDTQDHTIVYLNGSVTDIAGIDPPDNTKCSLLIIHNAQGASVNILDNSASAGSTQQRIRTGTNATLKLAANASLLLVYSDTVNGISRWLVIGGSGGGGGIGPTDYTTNLTLTLGGFIDIDTTLPDQTVYVSGNTAPTDLDQFQPFGTQVPSTDGSLVTVVGIDDAKPIRMQHGDVGQYAANGPFAELVFFKHHVAKFKYDAVNEKWILQSKNF